MEDIKVSILCITYNHGDYIQKALEGFVNQETNFKYEVLIHDDASNDHTADIIREYETKYPDIIKPIYQKENQFSKGIKISKTFNYPRVKGKYVAFCEGDDYWVDKCKLQKQYDFLETNKDFSMCCHSAYHVDVENNIIDVKGPFDEDKVLNAEDVILEAQGWIATASIFARAEFITDRPQFFYEMPTGDYSMRLSCFAKGKVYYFKEIMSAYRISLGNRINEFSYVSRMKKDPSIRVKERMAMNKFLYTYDEYTGYKYSRTIKTTIDRNNLMIAQAQLDKKAIKRNIYFKSLGVKSKISIWFKTFYPNLFQKIKTWYSKLKK